MKTHAYDRHPAVPPAEQRPHPQVLETMLDELEDKVRHYFLLYMKEKQKRQKAEKFSYWLQREVADSRQQLEDSRSAAAALEAKLLEIRGDPDAVRDTVQRVDLMYAQIDTLVQAFAGVCSFVATQEADKATVLQCVLEYLYPCRALDPRLGSLYGALYYYRLGERKGLPQQPPPPPEPKFMPVYEVMGPWIQPSPFTATPAPPLHATKFDAALAATLEAAKAQEVAQEDPQRQPKKAAASPLSRAKEAQTIATTTSSGTAAAGAAGSRAKASLPQQAADASADVDLKGFSVLLEELSGFKRPSLSKGTGVKLVVRFDHESSVEAKRKAERCIVIEKCDGKAGDESASIYFLAELSPLPPKKAGVVPKICIDIYDNKSPTGLGSANKLFTDPDTVKKGAAWQIKDARGTILGSITVSIAPLPLNALLPAQAKSGGAKALGDGVKKKEEPTKSTAAKPSASSSKPALSKPSLPSAKPELSKPSLPASKPELPKPSLPSSKPDQPKPSLPASKPELPKPSSPASKPELPKPSLPAAKPELPKPSVPVSKPDLPKPGLATGKAELAKPVGAPKAVGSPVGEVAGKTGIATKPDLPKPPLGGQLPQSKPGDLPKSGAAEAVKKSDQPKTGAPPTGLTKPGASPPGPSKPAGGPLGKPGPLSKPGAGLSPPDGKQTEAGGPPKPDGSKTALPAAGPGAALSKPPLGTAPVVKTGVAPASKPGLPAAKDPKTGGAASPAGPPAKKDAKLPAATAKPGGGPPSTAGIPPKQAKEAPDAKIDAKKSPLGKPGEAPKPPLGAPSKPTPGPPKPDLSKPALAKPALAKPALAKPALAKPALAKPALAKPALAKPGLAKPVIPSKPLPALAKGAPAAKPALAPKPLVPAKPALSKPGLPPAKGAAGKAA